MTGIFAALASRSTGSQPVSTTGARMITSTFCAMKARMALIWFSCFCWASENFSSMPRLAASPLIDSVSAVRHALSAPICENPTVIFFSSAWAVPANRIAAAMVNMSFFMCRPSSFSPGD